jgi:outer membrane protein OmpA-like peptidoglycan-associated protein
VNRIFLFGQNHFGVTQMKNSMPLKIVFILTVLFISASFVFAQVDVPRQTLAITYPRDEAVTVKFKGTTRFPRMSGEAKVKRTSKNGTEIDLSIDKMPRPFELGPGYATYVLWAISPDGQVDNLGEIKRRGGILGGPVFDFDSTISVTTPLQTFALIVTAEPHFLVRRPSRTIMLENLNPVGKNGRSVPVTKSVQYFGNQSDYFRDPRTPEIAEADYSKTPITILQAKQAVALARFSGAERDANDELKEAVTLLQNAENAWKAGRDEKQVEISARQSISSAVKAEETALVRKQARDKRNEKMQQDAELQKSEDKVTEAERRINDLKAELASEQRARELAERDASNFSEQVKQLRNENARLSEELGRVRAEAEGAKVQLARFEGEKQAFEKQRQQDELQKEQEDRAARLRASIPILIQSLKPYGTVRQTERGIVLTLSDAYWASARVSNLSANSQTKLANLANILANNKDYKLLIESHTDNKGTPEELQTLSEARAQSLLENLTSNGVDQTRFEVKGFGASVPIVTNATVANRTKNRRVDLILVPAFE